MKMITLEQYLLTLDDDTQKCINSLMLRTDFKIEVPDIQDFKS